MKKLFLLLLALGSFEAFSQDVSSDSLVQFSGVVVAGDSLEPNPK